MTVVMRVKEAETLARSLKMAFLTGSAANKDDIKRQQSLSQNLLNASAGINPRSTLNAANVNANVSLTSSVSLESHTIQPPLLATVSSGDRSNTASPLP